MQDLGALVPSLVVCAAFLAGVFVLLRREMAPRRRNTEGSGSPEDMSAGAGISETEDGVPKASSAYEEAGDPETRRRSRD